MCQEQILNRIETRMGGLEYRAGFPTASTAERLYDEMDYQRAVLAHQISDNLVSYYSMDVGPRESIAGAEVGDLECGPDSSTTSWSSSTPMESS